MSARGWRRVGELLFYVLLVLFTVVVLFPFYWLLASSVKTPSGTSSCPCVAAH